MTQPLTTTDLEELIEAEVPCHGITHAEVKRTCDRPAALMARSHHEGSPMFKCLPCWQVWYSAMSRALARRGYLCCKKCGQQFPSVESFADYRPF